MVPGKTLKLAALALLVPLLGAGSCKVKDTTKQTALPLQSATLEELVAKLNEQHAAVRSINAEAELVPTTGSAYSGVIEEYHDVKTFVLAQREYRATDNPREAEAEKIRLIGQAPIVRKTVFDMVADEREFRILLPTKNKFIVGPTALERRSEKPIENLRPQHLLEALFLSAPASGPRAQAFLQENEFRGRRYYAVTEIVEADGAWRPARQWWFDRTDLSLVRAQSFDTEGRLLADIHYAEWKESDGIPYPRAIELVRPQEDYRLKLLVKKLALNQPLPPERFRLEPPAGVETVELESKLAEKESR
jgi:outer membrane lipoprotein-sorting protein